MKGGRIMPVGKLESLGGLQRFSTALEANSGELTQYEGARVIFEEKVTRVNDLSQEQAELTARKQDVSRQLQYEMAEASRLATVLRLAVKSHYGIDSEKLVEFGIQPFRGRARKVVEEPETPPLPEAPAPAVVPDVTGL